MTVQDVFEIVPMTYADIPDVLRIEQESFPCPWTEYDFRLSMEERGYSVVAKINGKPIGYGVSWIVGSELHIGNLAVAKAHRAKGYGEAILIWLLDEAEKRGLKMITLEVRMSNQIAQNLYRKHGFFEIAIRRNYYRNPREDALVMLKDIDK